MKSVPNHIVATLLRALPLLIAEVNTTGKSTKVRNAVRMTKLALTKLKKIDGNGKMG